MNLINKWFKKGKILSNIVKDIASETSNAIEGIKVFSELYKNKEVVKSSFLDCYDLVEREFVLGIDSIRCCLYFIQGLADKRVVNEDILKVLLSEQKLPIKKSSEEISIYIEKMVIPVGRVQRIEDIKSGIDSLFKGNCLLFADGSKSAFILSARGWEARKITESKIEPTVLGPQEAFVEDLSTNTSILRRIIATPDYKMIKLTVGKYTKTEVVVCYLKGIAKQEILNEIIVRIKAIETDSVLDSSIIEKHIEDNPLSPFPQVQKTEKPDKCCAAILGGRFVIICECSPTVLIVPVVFSHFLISPEDTYMRFYFATLLRWLRYISVIIALLAPSVYVAVTTFHQEMIPKPLLVTIANARSEIPFPAVAEAFIMEITFEILREAGIRIPAPIGPAITIVGGLVIGQGAVQAGVVSQIMVIVVATTGIASFVIPSYNQGISIRFLRFPMMLLAGTLGLYGIIMGILFLLMHMASLRSFGVPYLSPAAPLNLKSLKEMLVKTPGGSKTNP